MLYVRNVGCSGSATFEMCDVWDAGFFGDVGCWRCGVLGMQDVRDVGSSICVTFGMCDVQDMGCSGCVILGMWNVGMRDAGIRDVQDME